MARDDLDERYEARRALPSGIKRNFARMNNIVRAVSDGTFPVENGAEQKLDDCIFESARSFRAADGSGNVLVELVRRGEKPVLSAEKVQSIQWKRSLTGAVLAWLRS